MEQIVRPHHPAAEATQRWDGRPRLAALLGALAGIVPLIFSIAATWLLASIWSSPSERILVVAWWIGLVLAATVVLVLVDRLARRLLPLATLLKMSLIFPDAAPSRFGVAMRAATTKQLERDVSRLCAVGLDDDETVAALQMLELVAALSRHDRFTRGHSERVRAYALMIAEEMGLSEADTSRLQWAALIHDVGKLAVPVEVLTKPGQLTDEEFELIKTHPTDGALLAEPLRGWLGEWVDAVAQHHERPDGTGYPLGLRADQIGLAAKIVSVADAFDVITAARSYKRPMSPQFARQELANGAGTQFDDEVVRAFLSISIGRLRLAMGPLSWLAQLPHLGAALTAPAANVVVAATLATGAATTGVLLTTTTTTPTELAMVEQTAPLDTSSTTARAVTSSAPTSSLLRPSTTQGPAAPTTLTLETVASTTAPALASTTGPSTTAASGPAASTPAPSTTVARATIPPSTTAPTTTPTTAAPPTTVALTPCEAIRAGETDIGAADLRNCGLRDVEMVAVNLAGADLRGADLRNVVFTDGALDGANLTGANVSGARIERSGLTGTVGTNLLARGITIVDSGLIDGSFVGADFSGSVFVRVSFDGSDLTGANFDGMQMEDGDFNRTTGSDTSFTNAQLFAVWIQSADLPRANFTGADLTQADLRWSSFTDGRFSGTPLDTAQLDDARFVNADFTEASMWAATGAPADVSGAIWAETKCPNGVVGSVACFG